MTIWKKIDVQGNPQPILWKCFGFIVQELTKHGVTDVYITSIMEGIHALTSFHYIGLAIDWKQTGIENEKAIIEKGIYHFCNKYKISVNDFDLIMYTDSRKIFHLEYDPK